MSEITEVAKVVGKYLKQSGKNVAYIGYCDKIQEYLQWYRGKTAWHSYFAFNGENNIQVTRATLGMAKTVCEDMASLEMNEKCKIKLDDERAQEFIDEVLESNNFREQASKLMELKNALGSGAFVEGIEDNKIKLFYIHGDMIFPLSWSNGIVTECAFVKIGGTTKDVKYTLIMHLLEDGEYVIKTVELNEKGDVVMPMQIGTGLSNKEATEEQVFRTGNDKPLFQVLSPNIVNNYDKTNPLGMSMFGNAIDILKSIDLIYDSYYNEFLLGKKRIFVKSGLKKILINAGKEVRPEISPSDTLFYQLSWGENGQAPIYESNMSLRVAEHNDAMNMQLNLLSRKVGLGDGFYEYSGGKLARTATEIISTNSSLFRNLRKFELVDERAIKGMVRGILVLAKKLGLGNFDTEQKITINFDDSIITDTEKVREQAMAEYNAGLIDQVEYFAITRNMTREQAEEFVNKMKETDTMKQFNDIMDLGE